MAYAFIDNRIGCPDVTTVAAAGSLGAPWVGTTSPLPSVPTEARLGEEREAFDSTLGQGTFILLAVPVSTTVTVGALYQWDKSYTIVIVPVAGTSKNTGVAVAVAYTAVTSNASSIQYAWFLKRGIVAVLKTAVTASPQAAVYISATAGRIKFVSSTGQQILGARTQNTATITTTTSTVNVYFSGASSLEGA